MLLPCPHSHTPSETETRHWQRPEKRLVVVGLCHLSAASGSCALQRSHALHDPHEGRTDAGPVRRMGTMQRLVQPGVLQSLVQPCNVEGHPKGTTRGLHEVSLFSGSWDRHAEAVWSSFAPQTSLLFVRQASRPHAFRPKQGNSGFPAPGCSAPSCS